MFPVEGSVISLRVDWREIFAPAAKVSIVVKESESPIKLEEKLSVATVPFIEIPTPNGAPPGAVVEIETLIT
ncbi:SipL SPOCS domain-containing protein [Bacillus paramycoides]